MWTCANCGEKHEDQFETCWKCGESLAAPPLKDGALERPQRRVGYQVFRGTLATWENLFSQAAELASSLGPERLISISHSEDRDDGVVAVWFWSAESGKTTNDQGPS